MVPIMREPNTRCSNVGPVLSIRFVKKFRILPARSASPASRTKSRPSGHRLRTLGSFRKAVASFDQGNYEMSNASLISESEVLTIVSTFNPSNRRDAIASVRMARAHGDNSTSDIGFD